MKTHDKQAAGLGTITRLPSGSYHGRITIGTDPVTGKQIRRSFTGPTRQAVQNELLKIRAEAQKSVVPVTSDSNKKSVGDAIDLWLQHLATRVQAGKLKPSTEAFYTSVIKHADPLRSTLLKDLTVPDVEAWVLTAGNAPASRRAALTALRAALKQAERQGWLARNPAALVEAPAPVPQREVLHATKEDVEALLNTLESPFDDIALVLAHTGLRTSEALALTWEDVDLTAQCLYVRTGKTQRSRRTVPLTPTLLSRLRKMRKEASTNSTHLFPSSRGGSIDRRTFARAFEDAAPRKGLTPHSLRHGFVTRLLEQGVPVHVVSALAGHSDPSITMRIYSHSVSELERDAVRGLDM